MSLKQQIFPANLLVLELIFCLLLSVILGFAIGFERKMRFKEAGVRTHTIVCLGSCMYMLVSMYAFEHSADISRVAAQIVPGIGFIGAGMIFFKKKMVHGLTTAAGIWATAAVGMAVGAGWYIISAFATVLIIGIQCLLHVNVAFFHSKHFDEISIVFKDNEGTQSKVIRDYFGVKRFNEISVKKDGNDYVYSAIISTDRNITAEDIYSLISTNSAVVSVSRHNDDF